MRLLILRRVEGPPFPGFPDLAAVAVLDPIVLGLIAAAPDRGTPVGNEFYVRATLFQ